jgi:hypothetical protein
VSLPSRAGPPLFPDTAGQKYNNYRPGRRRRTAARRSVRHTRCNGRANHINTIADSLAIAHMIALRFRIAASFKNRLVRTFWQAGSTGDTFIGNQQRHDPRLLLHDNKTHTVDKFTPSRPLCVARCDAILVRRSFPSQQNGTCSEGLDSLCYWAFGLRAS